MTQIMAPERLVGRLGTQQLGILCIAAGVLGAVSGVLLAVVDPAVPDTRYSYPLSSRAFVAVQAWFVFQHLGLLAGIAAMDAGRVRLSGAARSGFWLAFAGMALLTATEIAAAFGADFDYRGTYTTVLDTSYGLTSTMVGVGLVLAGIGYARRQAAEGWWRFVPLATGVFVFVPMFPAMLAGFTAARLGISGWMLMFALLGWSMARRRDA